MLKNRCIAAGLLAGILAIPGVASRALALTQYGPLQISGDVETQNLIRHSDIDQWSLVQQRNTLKARFDLDVIKDGKSTGVPGFELPGVQSASFLLFFRPVYDSIYDIKPGGRQFSFPWGKDEKNGDSMNAFTTDVRNSIRNTSGGANDDGVREFYLDLGLDCIPLSFRVGRQQVIWGETDNFRLLDRVNPLDVSWHLQQESWDELRIPLWMFKSLYKIGDVGPISEAFVEGYWGLGDWVPIKARFQPYPWSIATPDPFTIPATCTDPNNSFTCQHFKFADGGVPFRKGTYSKDPIHNGQWGARLVFNTPFGVQMGLLYFYNRFPFDDGTDANGQFKGINQTGPTASIPLNNLIALGEGKLPAEVNYPYVHTVGLTANYADDQYTQTVYRMEMEGEIDAPFLDVHNPINIVNPDCVKTPRGPTCAIAPIVPSGFNATSNSPMWNGMIAFDRPTWIRFINPKSTVFLTGQFFWTYVYDNPLNFVGSLGPQDKVRRWESLATFAASTFMGPGGTFQPLAGIAVDYINHYSSEAFWRFDYFITNTTVLRIFQNYFFVAGYGGEVDEHWGIGGLEKKRDETGIKLTQQF
jgi:hypothetical protein